MLKLWVFWRWLLVCIISQCCDTYRMRTDVCGIYAARSLLLKGP